MLGRWSGDGVVDDVRRAVKDAGKDSKQPTGIFQVLVRTCSIGSSHGTVAESFLMERTEGI